MNALRHTRLFVLVGLLAVIVLGLSATSAEAGGYGFKTFYSPSYCNYTPTYYTASYCTYPNYCNYGTYNYGCYTPAVNYCPGPYCYPVTTYDCYGRPSVAWNTSYSTIPVHYAP
jgi:hypothetical protein